MDVLKYSKIPHLYSKLRSQNVTVDVLWRLNDEMLCDCKLNKVENLQYQEAKVAHSNANEGKEVKILKDFSEALRIENLAIVYGFMLFYI